MILILLVFAALASMAGAMLLPLLADVQRAAHIHLAFALGVMPLIMAAMTHFVPVLTRTRSPPSAVESLALVAWGGAAVIVACFIFLWSPGYRVAAALPPLIACVALGLWQVARARSAPGGVHPGLGWYVAALGCLAAGLLAVLAMVVWPEQYLALKRLHLHLNLFGFVGLTAVGTLQVLLPTAAARFDPAAASRLRGDLPPALAGALSLAIGAAWFAPLSWLGCVLWAWPLGHLGWAWARLYRAEVFRLHGPALLLATALAGLTLALGAGALHPSGRADVAGAGHVLAYAFLFPLLSGAAGQLLPLWLRPGRQTEWHQRMRTRLGFAAGVRGMLFLAAGLTALAGFKWAGVLALAGLLPALATAAWVWLQRGAA